MQIDQLKANLVVTGPIFPEPVQIIIASSHGDSLIEAVRYGDRPEVKAKLNQVLDDKLDREELKRLVEERALATDAMDASKVQAIREEMERAEARRLQPFYIESFFLEAFKHLGGAIREREPRRYEITHVPVTIRNRDRLIGRREAVLSRYERICFEKDLISLPGKPMASFVCPGHPLLAATIDLILERHRDLLKQGTVLIDPDDTPSCGQGWTGISYRITIV